MRVGLIDVDSHNFPNLCLMKLSEYHTRHGDRVEWWDPAKQYDLVYKSRVFTDTYSKDTIQVSNADKVIIGVLMNLVPGIALTNCIRDILAGDLMSGVAKIAEVFLIAVFIALGAVMAVYGAKLIPGL